MAYQAAAVDDEGSRSTGANSPVTQGRARLVPVLRRHKLEAGKGMCCNDSPVFLTNTFVERIRAQLRSSRSAPWQPWHGRGNVKTPLFAVHMLYHGTKFSSSLSDAPNDILDGLHIKQQKQRMAFLCEELSIRNGMLTCCGCDSAL